MEQHKGNAGKLILGAIGGLIIILLIVIVVVMYMNSNKDQYALENNVRVGNVENYSAEERAAQMQEVVDNGMISISINATPFLSLSNPGEGVNWVLQNPETQQKYIRVEVRLDETNEIIYETGMLPPNTYVNSAPITKELDIGVYPCTATFFGYKLDTQVFVGQAGAKLDLTILG